MWEWWRSKVGENSLLGQKWPLWAHFKNSRRCAPGFAFTPHADTHFNCMWCKNHEGKMLNVAVIAFWKRTVVQRPLSILLSFWLIRSQWQKGPPQISWPRSIPGGHCYHGIGPTVFGAAGAQMSNTHSESISVQTRLLQSEYCSPSLRLNFL